MCRADPLSRVGVATGVEAVLYAVAWFGARMCLSYRMWLVGRVTLRSSNGTTNTLARLTRKARALTQGTQGHATPTPHAHAPRRSAARGLEAGPRDRPRACPPLVIRHPPWPRRHAACLYAAAPRERSAVYTPPPPASAPLLSTP